MWIPITPQWLILRGDAAKDELVRDLHFRGLSFHFQSYTLDKKGAFFGQAESALGAAIEVDGARDVSFENCEFAHTLTNVAWFHHGCHAIALRACNFHDLGAGGVKIGAPEIRDAGPLQSDHVAVENCIIQSGGRFFPAAIGVTIFHASDCTIRHCDIGDFFYSAISIGWEWGYRATNCARNIVEDCHLHHLGWAVLSDMAAVYTLGPQPGTVIRGCDIHDIGVASYGGWGMYNDEGSTGILWENNLVHHTQDSGYHQHYGRDNLVRNNIIADCAEEHVRRSRAEDFFAFTFEHNIVLLGDGKLFAPENKNWRDGRVALHDNVYWKPGGTIKDFAGKTWAEWQASGQDKGSLVTDPLFVDPAHGDWTLRADSPALKIGFVPFDWKQAGVTGDVAWRQLAAREFPPMKYGLKPKAPPLNLHDGFETTAPGGKPMRAFAQSSAIAVVSGNAGSGERCLQLTDGPDVQPEFDPHFFYSPAHERGTTRCTFQVRAEPGYNLLCEWRDDAEPYHTGPMLQITGGALSIAGRKLADLSADAWTQIEMTAKLGPESDGTWSCTIIQHAQPPQHFEDLKFNNPAMKTLDWLGFIGAGKERARCWLDEIAIENKAP